MLQLLAESKDKNFDNFSRRCTSLCEDDIISSFASLLTDSSHSKDKRQWAQIEIQEISFEQEKKPLFYREGGQTLAQVALSAYVVSIHGHTQTLTGHGPEQLSGS